MRTTLDIDVDVLAAAKELARRRGTSAGHVVSQLLRSALNGTAISDHPQASEASTVAGFRPFPARGGQVVTNDAIDQLRDEAGL